MTKVAERLVQFKTQTGKYTPRRAYAQPHEIVRLTKKYSDAMGTLRRARDCWRARAEAAELECQELLIRYRPLVQDLKSFSLRLASVTRTRCEAAERLNRVFLVAEALEELGQDDVAIAWAAQKVREALCG